jgi:hypothetical protein
MYTFGPVKGFGGDGVDSGAPLFADGFGTTAVCHPDVVTNAPALCTRRNRQVSLHSLMIRPCRPFRVFHTERRPQNGFIRQAAVIIRALITCSAKNGTLVASHASHKM